MRQRWIRSRRGLTAFRCIAVVSSSMLLALVAPTSAFANQGGHFRGGGSDAGSRASITGSSSVPTTGGVIATARVQGGGDGLFQVGHIKEGANFTSNCGTGTIGFMVERKAVGGSYLCNAFFGSFGSNHKFSALHVSGSGWNAYIDGVRYDGPYALGFTSGYAYAVGEYNGTAPSSYLMTFGPSGYTPWQYTIDRTTWNTVTSASTFDGGGWFIGSVPSPFNISR